MQTVPYSTVVNVLGSGTNYVFLLLPEGKLKGVQALNTTTYYQRVVLYLSPLNSRPQNNITQTYSDQAHYIGDGQCGSQYTGVVQDLDTAVSGQYACLMAAFHNCGANDVLELRAEIEVN